MESESGDPPFPGVRALDHTADVGIEVNGTDLPELLRRAARGLTWLLLEREPAGTLEERPLRASAEDAANLLREVLRELLWWHESEGLATRDLSDVRVIEREQQMELTASARLVRDDGVPIREIKGVTLHGLFAERRDDGWWARVIFDV